MAEGRAVRERRAGPRWCVARARRREAGRIAWLAGVSLPEAWAPDSYRAELERREAEAWVVRPAARATAPAVGFLATRRVLDELHVLALAVAPAFRRRAAGSALLASALDAADATGVRRIHLEVRAGNRAARSLYARHGFAITGRRPRHYADGEEALLLARPAPAHVATVAVGRAAAT